MSNTARQIAYAHLGPLGPHPDAVSALANDIETHAQQQRGAPWHGPDDPASLKEEIADLREDYNEMKEAKERFERAYDAITREHDKHFARSVALHMALVDIDKLCEPTRPDKSDLHNEIMERIASVMTRSFGSPIDEGSA